MPTMLALHFAIINLLSVVGRLCPDRCVDEWLVFSMSKLCLLGAIKRFYMRHVFAWMRAFSPYARLLVEFLPLNLGDIPIMR